MKALSIFEKNDVKALSRRSKLQDITSLYIQNASNLDINFSIFQSLQELWISSKQEYQIPNSFVKLDNLNKFVLGKNCFLPEHVHFPKNLRELWLKKNNIHNPPHNIRQSQSIKELILAYYGDIEPCPVPEWIFDMAQIEKIRFTVCRFTKISEKINQLENLVSLDFGCSLSDLKSFPDLSGLKKLKHLVVRYENIQGQNRPSNSLFPQVLESIKELNQLESLDLSFWQADKKSILDIFDRYPHLKELSLCGMKLNSVPSTVLELRDLEYLSLKGNLLTENEIKSIIQYLPNCKIDSDFPVIS